MLLRESFSEAHGSERALDREPGSRALRPSVPRPIALERLNEVADFRASKPWLLKERSGFDGSSKLVELFLNELEEPEDGSQVVLFRLVLLIHFEIS